MIDGERWAVMGGADNMRRIESKRLHPIFEQMDAMPSCAINTMMWNAACECLS
jgi:hypothetical protein